MEFYFFLVGILVSLFLVSVFSLYELCLSSSFFLWFTMVVLFTVDLWLPVISCGTF